MIHSLSYVNSKMRINLLLFQFYVVSLLAFHYLIGIWIINIAIYASVKQRPRPTEIGRNNLTVVPTNPSQGSIPN